MALHKIFNKNLDGKLIKAIQKNKVSRVQQLLALGADVNARDKDGFHALYHAARTSNATDILDILIAAGAEIDAKTPNGGTALIGAAYYGRKTAVQKLIAAGANVNIQNTGGGTALNMAFDSPKILQLLIDAGADLNVRRDSGHTALTLAALNSHATSVQILLAAGADATIRTNRGDTAKTAALKNDNLGIAEMLGEAQVAENQKKATGDRELLISIGNTLIEFKEQLAALTKTVAALKNAQEAANIKTSGAPEKQKRTIANALSQPPARNP